MDLLNEVPVTLVVKAPNQKVADQTVECALNWTVRKLKEHLARVYPSNPTENQQKIIYSGRLLQDDVTLKEVLRPDEKETVHTVHLVCSNLSSLEASMIQNISSTSSNSSLPTSEGLRLRRTAPPSEATQAQDSITHQQQQQLQQPNPEQSSATTTNSATERLQFHASAFHPSHYNPFMSAYLPHGAVGMTTPPAANNTTYSMEQMMWLQQQAYVQYMTNYFQLFQQGVVPPGQPVPPVTASPIPANQDVAQNQPVNAVGRQQQPQALRMNAQGGPVVNDDDDDEMERDWLDWFYVGVRFALLMCILYFYSTPARFLITLLLMILVCMLQNGRFHVLFRRRQDAPAAAAAVDPNHDADADVQPDDVDTGGETTPEEPRGPLRGFALAWEVFVSFFASLAPQPPPQVHAN